MTTFRRSALLTTGALLLAIAAPQAQEAEEVHLRAELHGGNEVPGVTTGAHGFAEVTANRTAGTVTYRVVVYNLPTGITASHIHVGAAGTNGPIILDFMVPAPGQSNDFEFSGTLRSSQLLQRAAQGINSFDDAIFAMASGVTYVNVHSQANPGGEIRGQLCPQSASSNTLSRIAVCTSTR